MNVAELDASALADLLDGWSDSEWPPLPDTPSTTAIDAACSGVRPSLVQDSAFASPATGDSTISLPADKLRPVAAPESHTVLDKDQKPVIRTVNHQIGAANAVARPSRSNVTRVRERQELQALQLEINSLERVLETTKQQRLARDFRGQSLSQVTPRVVPDPYREHSNVRHLANQDRSNSMWKQVALNQLLAKQKAEIQNAALREVLQEQLRLSKSIERMVNKRPNETMLHRALGGSGFTSRKRLCVGKSDDDVAFHRLFEQIEQVFAQVDFMSRPGSRSLSRDLIAAVRGQQPLARCVAKQSTHVTYSAVIPFDMKAAIATAWQFLRHDQLDVNGGEYRAVKCTDSTIASKSTASICPDPTRAGETRLRIRCAMKKMEERDRIVLVWQSSTAEVESCSSDSEGRTELEQRGWVILTRAPAGTSENSSATLVEMCVQTPEVANSDSPKEASPRVGADKGCSESGDVSRLSELLFRDAQTNVGIWYQYVENILMEQQRRRQ